MWDIPAGDVKTGQEAQASDACGRAMKGSRREMQGGSEVEGEMQQQERAENQVGEKADALIQVTCVHPLWRLGMERVYWS